MSINRFKIFVSAYACEPNSGSEIGVGWHWVNEMSKYFDLWVLTRKSNQKNIEEWLINNHFQNEVHFIYFDLPEKFRFWKKGLRGVRLYYVIWQILTNRIIRRTMEEKGIEIYHLLTYGNALWPVSNYGKKQLFVWGPTSAGDYIPYEYTKHYSFKWQLIEAFRSLLSITIQYNPGFRKKCTNANLILCKTTSTLNCIPEKYRYKALLFTDVAVDSLDVSRFTNERKSNNQVKYLAVGRLDPWRGFDLLIEAFSKAVKTNKNIRLEIIGKGTDKKRLLQIVYKHNVQDYISLSDQVSMEQYYQRMSESDVIVNPSLKEAAVTVSFDSISFRKPLICVETGGYTNYFANYYATVLPRSSRPDLIENLHKAIIIMADEDTRKRKIEEIEKIVDRYTWEKKGEQIHKIMTDTFESIR